MKLDWKVEGRGGTIRRLNYPIEMVIHKIVGCGNGLYLSCYGLNVSQCDLETEDWDTAEEKAIKVIESTVTNLHCDMMELIRQHEVAGKEKGTNICGK